MNFLKSINQLSFKKLTGITFLVALVLAIPISVLVVQQQTKYGSKAYFEKPQPIVPGKKYGSPSEGNPQITLVWPFLGKVGDSVLIQGKNLGNNPVDKSLKLGNQKVAEEKILRWTPELIEFLIPPEAQQGPISLIVVNKSATWNFPFTVYTLETKVQVTENNDIVKVLKGPAAGKAEIFFRDGEKIESDQFGGISIPSDKTIISVLVKDKNNSPVAFFVEPREFGF